MPIEFTCTSCSKTLRVADQAAGKQARCPNCSTILTVPAAGPTDAFTPPQTTTPSPSKPQPFPTGQSSQSDFGSPQPFSVPAKPAVDTNPYASPNIDPATPGYGTAAHYGGAESIEIRNQRVDAGQVITYAVEVWKAHLGLLIAVVLVTGILTNVVNYVFSGAQVVFEQMNEPELSVLAAILGFVATQVVNIFLTVGQIQVVLKLVRGQPAVFSELFQGGSRFLPTLGFSILFGLALVAGLILLVIPFFILMLMWWPGYYLVVDNKSKVMDSFSKAQIITQGNWGTTFLLWLASIGISLAGCLACFIGLIFAAPLIATMFCVAYLMMSGQIQANAVYQKATYRI